MDVLAKRIAYVYDDDAPAARIQVDLQGIYHPEERKEALCLLRRLEGLAHLGSRVIGWKRVSVLTRFAETSMCRDYLPFQLNLGAIPMATNPPKGDNHRNGAVRSRSQTQTPSGHFVKRNTDNGRFMDVKSDKTPFKGVRKEK